jgi:uncharacterized protein YraI
MTWMMPHRLTRTLLLALCFGLMLALLPPPAIARAETGSNWTGAYYNNPALSGSPTFTRIDPAVVFNWGPNPPAPGIGTQFWSARWQTVQYFNAGQYRFTVSSDDGLRIYINGQLVHDRWRDQSATPTSFVVQFSAGTYALNVEYYQATGDASVSVTWGFELTPSAGWTAQYFNNPNLQGSPALTRLEPQIDYLWGLGSPDPRFVQPDYFSARWTATLPFNAGTYRFTLAGDDGLRLYINDVLVIDRWQVQRATSYVIDVPLSTGLHTLRVEYFEFTEQASIRLRYEIAVGPPNPVGIGDDWYNEFYPNQNLQGPASFIKLDGRSGVNVRWDLQPPTSPRQNFSARWTRRACGFGRPTTFTMTVDDGGRLFVDDILVIDAWRLQSATTYQATLNLSAGCHVIRFEYFQDQGQGLSFLTWFPPDGQTPPLYAGGVVPNPGTGITGTVNAGALNVRTGPGISFAAITQIRRGQVVTASQRNADASWVLITYAGGGGWVNSRFLTPVNGVFGSLPLASSLPPPPPSLTGVQGKLISGLRLRTGPSTAFPFVVYIEWGEVVEIIGRNTTSQWFQVRYGGVTGWIYAPYVIVQSGNLLSLPITG